jgi:hypothetical protein
VPIQEGWEFTRTSDFANVLELLADSESDAEQPEKLSSEEDAL